MRHLLLILATAAALGCSACSTTRPWQRELLAKPTMSLDADGDRAALIDHVTSIREGATGGTGAGGGGCGCN